MQNLNRFISRPRFGSQLPKFAYMYAVVIAPLLKLFRFFLLIVVVKLYGYLRECSADLVPNFRGSNLLQMNLWPKNRNTRNKTKRLGIGM